MTAHSPLAPVPVAWRHFTVAQANRAVPYVRRIVEDIGEVYRDAVGLQKRLEYPLPDQDPAELEARYERRMSRLRQLVAELEDVGVELKDYDKGLVDFPAVHQGREVYLCWKLGEPAIAAWHEVEDGYAGRRDLDEL
ncbi:MAG: DUF2203 family protein [Planctomycetes bacterium]|jgi:hypothetical protein|nr:DUF2203 family protein [Planctomycetota bacterium]